MSEYKKIENAKAELICTLEGEKWNKAKEAAFKKLSSKVEIKGFRKGQAPKGLVEKYISNNEVLIEAAENLAQEALNEAVDEHNVNLIDRPQLKINEINDEKCVLAFECPVYPDVKIGNYKKLGYKVEEVKVDDKEVDDQISDLLNRKADLELKEDGVVEDNDTVVIDYEGFLDGVAFEGGKDSNHELVIGSNTFIPGFEEQLKGMKAEETKDIEVTFPEDYHAEELKGKKTKFTVTVHEIKKKVLPLLDDEFVKQQKIDNVNTVEELKNYTKDNIFKRKENDALNKAETELMDKLVEIVETDIPQVMIDSELNSMVQNYEQRLMQQGLPFDQFLKFTNQTLETFKESMKEDAIKRIKINLGLDEIAKKEDVQVNEEDINNEYQKMADMYGLELDNIKQFVPESTLKDDLRLQKALDLLKK